MSDAQAEEERRYHGGRGRKRVPEGDRVRRCNAESGGGVQKGDRGQFEARAGKSASLLVK